MNKHRLLSFLCSVLLLFLLLPAIADENIYILVTDTSELHANDQIILISDDGAAFQAMGRDFCGVQVTIEPHNQVTETDGILPLTLAETEDGWILAASDVYLAVREGALVGVYEQSEASVWKIEIASDGTAAITCDEGTITFAMQDGAYRFCCGGLGNDVSIFRVSDELEKHYFDEGLWWSFRNGTLTIGGNGDMSNFYQRVQPWSALRDISFRVYIQDGITSVGNYAFYDYPGLTSIIIPDSVISIGEHAFDACTGIASITIPDKVTSIGHAAFYGCTELRTIAIPNSVMSIGNNAFLYSGWWNDHPKGVVYLDNCLIGYKEDYPQILSVQEDTRLIAAYAFTNCSYLKRVTIPDSVKVICGCAFAGCKDLSVANIGSGVVTIEYLAFEGCADLTSITLPEGVTSIGESAFRGCTGIRSITIPNSVISIDNSAFENCSAATSLTIGNHTESIGERVFNGCTGLKSILIPDSVTYLGDAAFLGCTGLTTVEIGHGIRELIGFAGCTGLTSIVIPDNVTRIGIYAFCGCTGLSSITFGKDVKNISYYAFSNCTSLTDVYYHGTKKMHKRITINDFNEPIRNATWHYLTPDMIEMKTLPDQLIYETGEQLNVAGGTISVFYDYSIVEDEKLVESMVSGFDSTKAGKQILTVTFEGKSTTFEVEIKEKETPLQIGDIDGNGIVTSADAALILRYLVRFEAFSAEQQHAADINGDGVVTALDASKLLRQIVGLE